MGSSIDLKNFTTPIPKQDADPHRVTIADILNSRTKNFPGAQPVSFARKHFTELQQKDYYMCEKTDGIRCLLYLTEMDFANGPTETQFLIDRKNDYYYIPENALHLPLQGDLQGYHRGTLLDGELVLQKMPGGKERLMYLIFDMLCLDQKSIMNRQLDVRLGKIKAFVYEPWKELQKRYPEDVAAQPFQLQMKDMQLPYGAEMMFKDIIPRLPHGNDGLIFTCKETPYQPGTDPHILKWKPPHENTIDFRLQLGDFPEEKDADGVSYEDFDAKPEIELRVNYGRDGGYKFFAKLSPTDTEWEACKALNQQLDGRIVECFRNPIDATWRPKLEPDGSPRFRDDKTDANHISVVESVLDSIEDAVSEQDLISHAREIREAWKRREAERKEVSQRAKAQQHQRQQATQPAKQEEVDDGPRYED